MSADAQARCAGAGRAEKKPRSRVRSRGRRALGLARGASPRDGRNPGRGPGMLEVTNDGRRFAHRWCARQGHRRQQGANVAAVVTGRIGRDGPVISARMADGEGDRRAHVGRRHRGRRRPAPPDASQRQHDNQCGGQRRPQGECSKPRHPIDTRRTEPACQVQRPRANRTRGPPRGRSPDRHGTIDQAEGAVSSRPESARQCSRSRS